MKCRPNVSALFLVAVTAATGCINSTRVGLSNARASDARTERLDKTQDVIANGDSSCRTPGSAQSDPMPVRLVACPGDESLVHRMAARD
jgi:hypothetical protein